MAVLGFLPGVNVSIPLQALREASQRPMQAHLTKPSILDLAQSGFGSGHRNETPLMALMADILLSIALRQISVFVFLEALAAFDITDHEIQLSHLTEVAIDWGNLLKWLEFFLEEMHPVISDGRLHHHH